MTDHFKLPPREHERIYKRLEEGMLSSSSPSATPHIVILGGQPGAGKSFLARSACARFFDGKPVAVLNGDNYRFEHPHAIEILMNDDKLFAERTDPDVRVWTQRLLAAAATNRRNILFEGTMRNKEPLMGTISRLSGDGYRVDVSVLAVPASISRLGIIDRYEHEKALFGYARWTPMQSHDEAYRNLPETVAAIESKSPIDSINIYNRQEDLLYFTGGKTPSSDIAAQCFKCAAEAISWERNRDLSENERRTLEDAIAEILKQMKRRLAPEEEIASVSTFLQNW